MAGGKKDPINELSQKMLSGWILMAESCPLGCNVPLVENKKQGKIMCVSCDRHFVRDPSTSELRPLPPDVPLAVSVPQGGGGESTSNGVSGSNSNSNSNSHSHSVGIGIGSSASPVPLTTFSSASLMSSELHRPISSSAPAELHLDGPPSARRKDYDYGGDYNSVAEDDFDEDEDDYVPPTDEEMARHEERRKRNDKVSVEIGTKLLAGWTMLDTHCPNSNCRTVLMKDKHNQKWCLACNTMIITQDEYDSSKHLNVGGSMSEPTPKRSSPPALNLTPEYVERRASVVSEGKPPIPRSVVATPKIPTSLQSSLQSPHVRSLNSAGQAIFQSNIAPSPVHHSSAPPVFALPLTYTTQNQILDHSLQTLYQKMNEYTRLLSITTDLDSSKGLCELIRECGLAISALTGVHKAQK